MVSISSALLIPLRGGTISREGKGLAELFIMSIIFMPILFLPAEDRLEQVSEESGGFRFAETAGLGICLILGAADAVYLRI